MESNVVGKHALHAGSNLAREDGRGDFCVSDAEFAYFVSQGRRLSLRAGEQLFVESQAGRTMYIIESGQIELVFGDDEFSRHVGPRGFFGELGLLIGHHLRNVSARALCDCELLEVDHSRFQHMLGRDPACVASFLHRAIMRVVDNEQSLMYVLRRRNGDLQAALDSLREATDRLNRSQELTRTDELTGLCNRRGFIAMIEQLRKSGSLENCGLLIIDCDAFKEINDRYGHIAGDRLLQNVAHVLRTVSGSVEVTARLGGDEFCALASIDDVGELARMAEYLVNTVRALHEMHGEPPLICHFSIGGCMIDPQQDWEAWYGVADAALYRVKARGGDGYEIARIKPEGAEDIW